MEKGCVHNGTLSWSADEREAVISICYAYCNNVGLKGPDRGALIRRALPYRRVELLSGTLTQKPDFLTTKPENTEVIRSDVDRQHMLIGWLRYSDREANDLIEHFTGRHF